MLFTPLILVIYSKKTGYDTKISETEKKLLDHDYGKVITTQDFNDLTAVNFFSEILLLIL